MGKKSGKKNKVQTADASAEATAEEQTAKEEEEQTHQKQANVATAAEEEPADAKHDEAVEEGGEDAPNRSGAAEDRTESHENETEGEEAAAGIARLQTEGSEDKKAVEDDSSMHSRSNTGGEPPLDAANSTMVYRSEDEGVPREEGSTIYPQPACVEEKPETDKEDRSSSSLLGVAPKATGRRGSTSRYSRRHSDARRSPSPYSTSDVGSGEMGSQVSSQLPTPTVSPYRISPSFQGYRQGAGRVQQSKIFHSEARAAAHGMCHRLQHTVHAVNKGCKAHETIQRIPPVLATVTAVEDAMMSIEQAERTAADIPKTVAASKMRIQQVEVAQQMLHNAKNELFIALQNALK